MLDVAKYLSISDCNCIYQILAHLAPHCLVAVC